MCVVFLFILLLLPVFYFIYFNALTLTLCICLRVYVLSSYTCLSENSSDVSCFTQVWLTGLHLTSKQHYDYNKCQTHLNLLYKNPNSEKTTKRMMIGI